MISRKLTREDYQFILVRLFAKSLAYKHSLGFATLAEVRAINALESLESYERELESLIEEADLSDCPSAYDEEYWRLYDICSEIELELSELVCDLCDESRW